MYKCNRNLATAVFALCSFAGNSAHAEVLSLPASSALINAAYDVTDCSFAGPAGIAAGPASGSCDFSIPVGIPAGRTIQQIEVVYASTPLATLPEVSAYLSTLDVSSMMETTRFTWTSNLVPGGALQTTRLMQQTKFGGYPDAFAVQPTTMYQLFVHLEKGAYLPGIRITYQ